MKGVGQGRQMPGLAKVYRPREGSFVCLGPRSLLVGRLPAGKRRGGGGASADEWKGVEKRVPAQGRCGQRQQDRQAVKVGAGC